MDVAHCGGILEARLIAAMAESYYVQLAPHSWYGPVSLVASLHLDACISDLLVQEWAVPNQEPPQQRELLETPLAFEGGQLHLPPGAGLGLALNEEVPAVHRLKGE